jgi:hypothetical protein
MPPEGGIRLPWARIDEATGVHQGLQNNFTTPVKRAEPMPRFEYTPENLTALERTLSPARLSPYLAATGNHPENAIRLYEQNTLLSESLYGVLQGLEIALRNSVHERLSSVTGSETWWARLPLAPDQLAMLQKAEDALRREGKPLDAGRIVAELSFGFWTSLFGPRYSALWNKHLVKAFPRRPLQRSEVQVRLNSIRKLRNRVAHHEPILSRPLQKDVNQIFDALSWIDPITARWVRSNSSFAERYQRYRSIFPAIPNRRP